jgi:poly-beta-1,6-N-acetyl-D-glucosamine synthase
MKNVLYCLLYALTITMIVMTVVMPGSITTNPIPFFNIVSLSMIIVGTGWVVKSLLFMLLAPWYSYIWARRKRHFAQRNYKPLVSVVIPAWNEEVGLLSTVKTILASTYRPLEIVVVNDGSTDKSDAVMRSFIYRYEMSVRGSKRYAPIIYHYQQNGGKGKALNTGIALARGEIIVTFDADSVVHEEAVQHFVSYFADPEVMAAAGNIKVGNTKTLLGSIQGLEYMFGLHLKKAEALLGVVIVIGGAASAFRREVFRRLGGFHVGSLTEDMDLSLCIQEAGMKIVYVPEAIVHTEGPTSLRGLLKQRLRWKRGWLEAFHMHRRYFFGRQKGINKPFFWVILPLVIVEDVAAVLGALFTILLYVLSFMTHDFTILLATLLFFTIIFGLQFGEDKQYRKFSYFVLAPIVWYLFHLITFVQIHSLFKTLWTFYRKSEVKWQAWKRKGVADS